MYVDADMVDVFYKINNKESLNSPSLPAYTYLKKFYRNLEKK